MTEYLQALNAVRDILNRFPEVKQLIKLELNSQEGIQYVDFSENPKIHPTQGVGAVSTVGTGPSGEVPHEGGSGDVPNGNPSEVLATEVTKEH